MATTTAHSIVTEARDLNDRVIATPNVAAVRQNEKLEPNHKSQKQRSKYNHVAALHCEARPSCLSHETKETPSFLGFRNLMVLVIIVMNLRLIVENARKYGLLISLKFNISSSDLQTGLMLYALIPCHLFVAYIIERVAMENAKGAIGRRKKTDRKSGDQETEKDKREFYNTWWWIAFAHAINASLALLVTNFVVYYGIRNPGIGTLCELHSIIVWLKTISYAFTNRDLRHQMLHPSAPAAFLPDIYARCPYPQNITLANLCYFWWAPTLVYQPCYPRTSSIRWVFVAKRIGEVTALSLFMWVCCAQFAEPVLRNSLEKMAVLDYTSIAERLMKLSTISLVVWLAGFFALFQSFLNLLAELLMFGDRVFYEDWWNSTSLQTYWSTWNKPVYHFMRRHIYSPLIGRGYSSQVASLCVFIFSGVLHELAVGVPTHNILGVAFLGMVIQIPLIKLTQPLSRSQDMTAKVIGNCIFWINFVFVGQPLAAMIYFFAWQAKYGDLSQARAAPPSWTWTDYFVWRK